MTAMMKRMAKWRTVRETWNYESGAISIDALSAQEREHLKIMFYLGVHDGAALIALGKKSPETVAAEATRYLRPRIERPRMSLRGRR